VIDITKQIAGSREQSFSNRLRGSQKERAMVDSRGAMMFQEGAGRLCVRGTKSVGIRPRPIPSRQRSAKAQLLAITMARSQLLFWVAFLTSPLMTIRA
jgi:hypothetical protein